MVTVRSAVVSSLRSKNTFRTFLVLRLEASSAEIRGVGKQGVCCPVVYLNNLENGGRFLLTVNLEE